MAGSCPSPVRDTVRYWCGNQRGADTSQRRFCPTASVGSVCGLQARRPRCRGGPSGLDHMKVYTCGKKFLPTFPNRSMLVKAMAKANRSPNTVHACCSKSLRVRAIDAEGWGRISSHICPVSCEQVHTPTRE